MTPSSAATTITATSVTLAPRARMAVNASWPGVSRKVSVLPSCWTWYAPMCWVMPPASPAATWVWRIASSREVLPWSTWPITVTTGGRSTRSPSSSSSTTGSSTSSSAAVTISILRSNSLAIDSTDSSVSVWVRVAISPSFIRALITSAAESPRLSATSRTVAPELTLIGGCSSGCFSSLSEGSSSSGRRRRPPRRRGGRGGGWVFAM